MIPTYENVNVRVKNDSVALLLYNRPQSGNSLHPNLLSDMLSALKWADAEEDIKVIVQSGEGTFFSTGMELVAAYPSGDMAQAFSTDSDFYKLNKILISSRKILIAAVNGPAVGYGVSSLALFDLVYSVPDAYFFTPFVKWGMAAEGASSITFPRIMGHQKAASLFLAGERVTAAEFEKVGLITKILAKKDFLDSVEQIAIRITKYPQGSLRATKELMRGPVRQDLLDANERECSNLVQRLGTGEPQVAMRQFAVEQQRKKRENSSRL